MDISGSKFGDLRILLDSCYNNPLCKYLHAFDNYVKHIKTVLVTVKNSFLFGNDNEFVIKEFVNEGKRFDEVDALNHMDAIKSFMLNSLEGILNEVFKQVPNCLDNSKRIQSINFFQLAKEKPGAGSIEYIAFFIEVDNDLSDLPTEIKVLPLIVKPNGEIISFDLRIDKIFIKKKGTKPEPESVIGCAIIKNGFDTNEVYRAYTVQQCDSTEYIKYILSFTKGRKIRVDYLAMEGTIIIVND